MRPSARASVVLVLAVLALSSAPSLLGQFGQQPGFGQQGDSERFEIRGKVVNSVTGDGVGHALVQMYASSEKAVFSGDDGGFAFTDVPRGSFTVVAKKPGFFNEQELQRWNPRPYTGMVTVPQREDAVVKLTPEGIIYGRVTDENEEPIEGVSVQVQTWLVQDGRRRFQNVGNGQSDDQGTFRVAELLPGKYYLHFLPRGGRRPRNQAAQGQSEQEGFGSQFYPGVADAAAAGAIRVKAGAQVQINQVLGKQRVFEIAGLVRGVSPDSGFGLNLMDSAGDPVQAGARLNPTTGAFRFQGIPAGTYMLSVMTYPRNAGGDGQRSLNAYVPIYLNSDVTNLVLVPGRGASVGVEVDDQRTETNIPEGAPQVSINLQSEGLPQFGRGIMYPPPKQDRNSPRQFEGLVPGTYRVEAYANGPGYVAELRCGSVNLLRHDLVVPAGGTLPPIQVTLRSDGGQIFATAVKGGEPVPAMVVVYSEDYPRRSRGGWYGGKGSMGWGFLAPGRYRVVAIENADDLEFRNPAAMEKYLEHAVDVDLGPGDQKNVRVEVQEFQEAQGAQEAQGTDQ